MKTSLRYRHKIDICERLHELRLYKMSKVFPLASTELDLAKSEGGCWRWGGGEITKSGKLPSHLLLCRQTKISVTNSILPNTVIMSGR